MQAKVTPPARPTSTPQSRRSTHPLASPELVEQLTDRVADRVVGKLLERAPGSRWAAQFNELKLDLASDKAGLAYLDDVARRLSQAIERLRAPQGASPHPGQRLAERSNEDFDSLVLLLEASTQHLKALTELSRQVEAAMSRMPRLESNVRAVRAAEPPVAISEMHVAQAPVTTGQDGASSRWAQRIQRGEALRAQWVKDGLLVSSAVLAQQWHRSRQALDQASVRGELFCVKVGKNKFYPAAFLSLDAQAVKRVNLALKGDDGTAKFAFWSRRHAALGDRTVAQALLAGDIDRVVELAQGWSEEHGFGPVASP